MSTKPKARRKIYKAPKAPVRVQDIVIEAEARENLELPEYLLHLQASDWAAIDKVVADCIARSGSKVFNWEDLHQEHLDAFDRLSKSTDFTTSFNNYSYKLYHYYKSDNAEQEFETLVKTFGRKRKVNEAYEETRDEYEIAASKLSRNGAKEIANKADEDYGELDRQNSGDTQDSQQSNITTDYHTGRVLDYTLEEFSIPTDSTNRDSEDACDEKWTAGGFDVTKALTQFRDMSNKLSPKYLSDLRLLAINHIYVFAIDRASSVINYMDVYDENDLDGANVDEVLNHIKVDLVINEGKAEISPNIPLWTNELSQRCTDIDDWYKIQEVTIPFLQQAIHNSNRTEILAANILHSLAMNFSNRKPDMKLEDSFAHNIVSTIYNRVFQSDPLLSYQWANGHLDPLNQFKPDFIVFVSHRQDRYDVGVSEIKPPSNSNGNQVESDFVKIGKEMCWMLNTLVKMRVPNPVVGSILLEGNKMTTFKMDLKYPQIYRMIELASINLPSNLQGIGSFSSILSIVLQLKNVVKKTAIKAKKVAVAKSNGESIPLSPSLYYLVNSSYNLRAQRSKKSKNNNNNC